MSHSTHTLILLDVDGVLVHSMGYKMALRATVDVFAVRMGQPPLTLSDDEIALFESCGITNEWDSSAICISTMLRTALEQQPDLRRESLDATLAAIAGAGLVLPRPDPAALARHVSSLHDGGEVPSAAYLDWLTGQVDSTMLPLLRELLGDIYSINTPTTRTFQTHSLGSARFAATYGQPAPFEAESCLSRYDVPLLTPQSRDRLVNWAGQVGHGAAIFTARPSLPPADLPDRATSGYSPEGELAVDLLGLDGAIPLIAQGRVGWLACQNGRAVHDYVKPAPVQALAAIAAAASGKEHAALLAAADLAERGLLSGPLAALYGQPVRVILFEDSITGIRAAQLAVGLLREAGVAVELEAVGVSSQPDKQVTLAAAAGQVVDDINTGLARVLEA